MNHNQILPLHCLEAVTQELRTVILPFVRVSYICLTNARYIVKAE